MNLSQRSYQKEILDEDDLSFEDIRQNMKELNFINTWLGGHNISIRGLKQLAGDKKEISICEIGCGGGDNLAALNKWCTKMGVKATFTGIDIKKECIEFAKKNSRLQPDTLWIVSDYLNVNFEQRPDVIFSSLFCHHFTNDQLITQLQWMKQNSGAGFFINDLHRHIAAYHLIKWLTRLFSSSYLVKNDAPLSVARGFLKNEWITMLKKAGVTNYTISWQWAFRYLIVHRHD